MTFIAMDPIGTMADIDHIVNIKLTDARKESIARLMQFQPLAGLMVWGCVSLSPVIVLGFR